MCVRPSRLTPITLAARQERIGEGPSVLEKLIEKDKLIAWTYGLVSMTLTNLEQLDSFRIRPKADGEVKGHLDAVQQLSLKCNPRSLSQNIRSWNSQDNSPRAQAMETFFQRSLLPLAGQKTIFTKALFLRISEPRCTTGDACIVF